MEGQIRRFLESLGPWVAFLVLLLWVFPLKGIGQGFASYGDPLEILWNVEHHCRALAEGRIFLYAPEVLYPVGLDIGLSPHWMGVNLLFTPFCPFPNRIAVLNSLTLAALAGIFSGGLFAARKSLGLPRIPATLAAMGITFFPLQFFQAREHIDKLFGLVALTWLWALLLRAARSAFPLRWRQGFGLGLLWGVAILFSLYFFWLGFLLVTLLLGRKLREKPALGVLAGVTLLSLPWGLLFVRATRETPVSFSLYDLYMYSASPDLWPLPSPYHLWWGQNVGPFLNPQALEGSLGMVGPIPFVLGLVGLIHALRHRPPLLLPLLGTTLVGLCLSLGPYLKWHNRLVHVPWIEPVHLFLWRLGHFLKPGLFPTPEPPSGMADLLPLPGFLWILLPFAEGGRAMVRYLFVAAPGLFLAAGYALSQIPRRAVRWTLAVLWATEYALTPGAWKPLSPHSALEWLARQPGQGAIFSLDRTGMAWNPRELWGALLHNRPILHGSGSWVPPHLGALADAMLNGRFDFAVGELQQLGMEYLLVHRDGPLAETLYRWATESARLTPIGCFPPPAEASPWSGEICIFRSVPMSEARRFVFLNGWALPEDWGIWAEGETATLMFWLEDERRAVLEFSAFPLCVPGEQQWMEIRVNGSLWKSLRLETCDSLDFREQIPERMLRRYNILSFRFAYARAPAEIPTLQSGDTRRLSVGFTRLRLGQTLP